MAGKANRTYRDYAKQDSSISVWLPTLTVANIAAQTTLIADLWTAVDAVSLGNPISYNTIATTVSLGGSPAGSAQAHREKKWLVSFSDDVNGHPGTFTIPCADLTLLVANSDQMNIASGAGAALVTAIEAVVQSNTGHDVTVNQITFVGRNL